MAVAPAVAAAEPAPIVQTEVDTVEVAPTVVPLAAPVVEVEDEEVPLAVMDVEDEIEDDNVEAEDDGLIELENEEVPLANTNIIENVHHCIMHFIELIIAAALSVYYVGSTKKQKKEITGLKKEIEDKERR